MVDGLMSHADYLQAYRGTPSLEMMSHRMWTNVYFRYITEDAAVDHNELNTEFATD